MELDDHEFTVFFEMVMGQAQSAAAKGNTQAYKELIEMLKADEDDNAFKEFLIPASLLAKSFVDVNRMIDNRYYKEFVFKGGRFSTKSSFIALKIIELVTNNPDTHALLCSCTYAVFAQLKWAINFLFSLMQDDN